MSAKKASVELAFIVSTDTQKANPETRKLIRSHVMRGKNRVKGSSRKSRTLVHESNPVNSSLEDSGTLIISSIVPRPLCSELSTVQFADDVVPGHVADVISLASMFAEAMFSINQCMTSDMDLTARSWFAPLFFDPAYLYTMCFTAQTYFDGFLGRTRSDRARREDNMYYAKAIRILQDRLAIDDDSVKLSDSTIMTVLAMSGHAYMIGDHDSARDHINGALQLVSMRGIGTLFRDTKVLIEIIRSDLSNAIDNGSKPTLFNQNDIPWQLMGSPAGRISLRPPSSRDDITDFLDKLDPRLTAVWYSIHDFCVLINTATEKGGIKITEETFLQAMGSTMYRLLHLNFETGSLDEAIRLVLIAFSSPIFLHWNRVELPDQRFNLAFREALAALELRTDTSFIPQLWTWLLTVACLSMFYEPDNMAWLRPRLQMNVLLSGLSDWTHTRSLMGSFLWTGIVYDIPGKEIFDLVLPPSICEV